MKKTKKAKENVQTAEPEKKIKKAKPEKKIKKAKPEKKNDKKKAKENRPKKVNTNGLAGISLIVYLFDKLSAVIYKAFVNGLFGRIFTAYSSELLAYEDGHVLAYFKGGSKTRIFFRKIREFLSKNFETSFIIKKLSQKVCSFAVIPLKTYASFFLSFGIYTLLVYFIKMLLPMMGEANIDYLYWGIGICIVSFPLHSSKLNLSEAVRTSRITSSLFVDSFGYREEVFEKYSAKRSKRSGLPILLGLIAGMLTFLISPLTILLVILLFVVVTLVIISPEIGVLLGIFGIPFFAFAPNPTVVLVFLVLTTMFSYIIKLVRGKRILKLELIDFTVVFFLLIVLFSGAITVGGRDSYYSALCSCFLMFGYFLVVNLIRTEKWLHRCVLALVSSGTITATLGVLQYILGVAVNDWIDTSYFSNIQGRATSLFENPNYLAAYVAIVIPFAIYQTIVTRNKKERQLGKISCFILFLCAIFTWSRGAWVAILICTLIFFLMFTKKTMRLIFCALFSIPFLSYVLPQNIVTRFMSIGDIADSSTAYRVYTWKGSLGIVKDYFWGGIGYGTDSFERLYPIYSYAGIEAAPHSHSLYLQILIGMGIGGLLVFTVLMFFYTQKSFEYMKKPTGKDSYLITLSAFTSVLAMLIMGLFDYVWYNYRIFFLFWTVLALGVACARIGKRELSRLEIYEESDCNSASIDMEL